MHRPPPNIPDHTVLRKIGSGSYGEVWLARSATQALRAIKVIYRQDFDNEQTFKRELQGILHYEPIARKHPGLVHILHVGNDPQGEYYFYVMELGDDALNDNAEAAEYIPRTLASDRFYADNKPLGIDYCVSLGLQLSSALQYLHSCGLHHRDIKPCNIIFVEGKPKLADIGLVGRGHEKSLLGTEGFIPRQQHDLAANDIYALGKCLYEAASGKDRLSFPALPESLPQGIERKQWLALNTVICQACDPNYKRRKIKTAAQLIKALDKLRRKKSQVATALFGWGISLAACCGVLLYFGTKEQSIEQPDKAPQVRQFAQIIINSVPAGARIYDRQGNYLDQTPYGPFKVPANEDYSYTLRLNGYKDLVESGHIKADQIIGIGGVMQPYAPPRAGQIWHDALSHAYIPFDKQLVSENPISLKDLQLYARASNSLLERDMASTNGHLVMSPQLAKRYCAWLSQKSHQAGLLESDQTIVPDNKHADDNSWAVFYTKVESFTPATLNLKVTPADSEIFINNQLGKARQDGSYQLPVGLYAITASKPGYAPQTIVGEAKSGQQLALDIKLQSNGSVIFEQPWSNSLAQQFIPMGKDTLVNTRETTFKDFAIYCREQRLSLPKSSGIDQQGQHPVVNITRQQAQDFCKWLTQKERKLGLIDNNHQYSLPDDQQWTRIAAIENEEGNTPYSNDLKQRSRYSWDKLKTLDTLEQPPGNYADQSALLYLNGGQIIHNYNDKYPFSAPVGQFPKEGIGVHDLSGNVKEWISSDYGGPQEFKFRSYNVARGGSWMDGNLRNLNLYARHIYPPGSSQQDIGFRIILERIMPQ